MDIITSGLLNRLPSKSRQKIIDLQDERAASHAALREADDLLFNGHERRDKLEIRVRAQLANSPMAHDRKLTDEELKHHFKPVRDVETEIEERLKPRREKASAKWEAFSFLSDASNWLTEAARSGARLREAKVPIYKGTDFRGEVARCRAALAALSERFEMVQTAARPLSEARQAVIEEIDRIAERGRPEVDLSVREGSPLKLERAFTELSSTSGHKLTDPAATIVWALRDLIVKRAVDLFGTTEAENFLSDEDRDAAFERLASERLAIERDEEAAIVAGAAYGQFIERRRDADPRAIFEISDG